MTYEMVDAKQALRDRALTLAVVSITDSIAATADGYSRATGSFLTDKCEVGQEIKGTSFAASVNNEPKLITAVTALTLTTQGIDVDAAGRRTLESGSGTSVEGAGTRTLTVGLPADLDSENAQLVPGAGVPWWREEYSTTGLDRLGLGSLGDVEILIDYFITLFTPSGVGDRAAARYATALEKHFAPGLSITLAGTSFRVRGEPGPFTGQFVQSVAPTAGFFVVPVTVPLILVTANAI